jgi:hypothetical protein
MKNMGIFGPDIEKLMYEKKIEKLVKALKHVNLTRVPMLPMLLVKSMPMRPSNL